MRDITPMIPKRYKDSVEDPSKISSSKPIIIKSYKELVRAAAEFSFYNKDYLLFFRGQSKDHPNKVGNSSFYPSIYRGKYLPRSFVRHRFQRLEKYAKALVEAFKSSSILGYKEVERREYIQWSILQHYEVCSTPLLDFTHSLRVACSFAFLKNSSQTAYIFMFGLPYITNRVSHNSEHEIVNVRLLSICPPSALRPHFQEGYLAGTEDIKANYDNKTELDFNNRLVAKFEIQDKGNFWGKNTHQIPESQLFPKRDLIRVLCKKIGGLVSS